MRIRNNDGKLVPPGAFIEIAERSGMILQLGEIVFEKVCRFINSTQISLFGVSFSPDDFGTGQSNLNYIVDMPVEIVKFDKGMTNAYFENGKAKYIMNAAMNMRTCTNSPK